MPPNFLFICFKCICCNLNEKKNKIYSFLWLILQMTGKRNEVLVFFYIQEGNVSPQSKLIKTEKQHKLTFLSKTGQYKICSGATVFHRMVLNVTETDQKKKQNIFFSVENKSGIHVHQKCVRCSTLCLLLGLLLTDLSLRCIYSVEVLPWCSEDLSHTLCV